MRATDALAAWALLVNLAAFALMGADKRRAVRGRWRVAERALFLSALLGGAPGALLGMRLFRHKTKKAAFRLVMPVLSVIYAIVYLALLWMFLRR